MCGNEVTMKHDLLIIMPAYNEEASIGKFLGSLKEFGILEYADIIVINDASADHTVEILQMLNVPFISHPYNLGYGAALQTGYKYAVTGGYRYIIQMDSDGQHDACNIPKIYDCLRQKDTLGNRPDLVIGSRFLKESQSFPMPFTKKVAIRFFRRVIKIASHQVITDPTSGLQGLNRRVFEYYARFGNFDNNYPDANMLVQMSLLGYQIKEIPATMHKRTAGKSMHFGIIEPLLYMCIMLFSTYNVFVRSKWKLLQQPIYDKGGNNPDEKI
jgi:Glycosyltransferases involved in cell wall biogenesis